MKWLPLLLVAHSMSSIASADPVAAVSKAPPFAPRGYVRALLGLGGAQRIDGHNMSLTADFGARTFNGVFSSGFSTSVATDLAGHWFVVTPGFFIQLDLTYLFLSGLWAQEPPSDFPFRLQVGSRIGLDVSDSFPSREQQPYASNYLLLRPALHSFVDLEKPLDKNRLFSAVVRVAVDTPIALTDLFRWSVSIGISRGWGDG